MEEAIRQQVEDGELRPVEQSDWAAPIVVVAKKDGGIRICADFKVTINPQSQRRLCYRQQMRCSPPLLGVSLLHQVGSSSCF